MNWNAIANAGARKMQSFVSIITLDNWLSFMERDSSKGKVILLTDKKSTPALFKSLSKRFFDRLSFGEVRASEHEVI